MCDIVILGMINCAIFIISGHARSSEYKIQLQTILKLLHLYIHFVLPILQKILNHSFCLLEYLYCKFHNVEIKNCTFHIVENITKCVLCCGHYQRIFHIVEHILFYFQFCGFASIFMKISLVVNYYLISLSFKIRDSVKEISYFL